MDDSSPDSLDDTPPALEKPQVLSYAPPTPRKSANERIGKVATSSAYWVVLTGALLVLGTLIFFLGFIVVAVVVLTVHYFVGDGPAEVSLPNLLKGIAVSLIAVATLSGCINYLYRAIQKRENKR